MRIERVERIRGRHEALKIHFVLGSMRMSVCIESEDFTERKVKEAMARQIAMEFAFRQARQLVGKKFPLDVVMSEYKKGDVFDLW